MTMGLKVSPDVAQSMIENVLKGLDVEVYIDDIAIFSDDYMIIILVNLQSINLRGAATALQVRLHAVTDPLERII